MVTAVAEATAETLTEEVKATVAVADVSREDKATETTLTEVEAATEAAVARVVVAVVATEELKVMVTEAPMETRVAHTAVEVARATVLVAAVECSATRIILSSSVDLENAVSRTSKLFSFKTTFSQLALEC